ncbi:MAG: helix-turn-helix transcriptional regulator [Clostridia bacterium]|nr:helix-turn-helix transcriptional regulator [Clostridia bacterium]
MFKNKTAEGRNNICGENLYRLRKNYPTKMSQRILAEQMQLRGIDVDKNAIQRMECGKRFITDIEIVALAQIFDITCDELLTKHISE